MLCQKNWPIGNGVGTNKNWKQTVAEVVQCDVSFRFYSDLVKWRCMCTILSSVFDQKLDQWIKNRSRVRLIDQQIKTYINRSKVVLTDQKLDPHIKNQHTHI